MPTIQELGKKAKGAPKGNKHGSDFHDIKASIHWALCQDYDGVQRGHALKAIAKRAVNDALNGDKAARDWIADRYEGKAVQIVNNTTTLKGGITVNVGFD